MNTTNLKINFILIAVILFLLNSCDYEFPNPTPEEVVQLENADISKTVFLGGTLFSGVHNGSLTSEFSQFSVPQIFLNHYKGNDFDNWMNFSPEVESVNGFNIFENNALSEIKGQYDLVYPTLDTADFKRIITEGEPFEYSNSGGEILNFSFPKAQILDITEPSSSNPYLSSFKLGNTSVLDAAVAQDPTFFVLNLGFQDVLAFAQGGAEGNPNLNDINAFNVEDMPSLALFESKANQIVDAFLQSNSNVKGALFNIPDLLKLPYFIEVRFDITPFIQGTPSYSTATIQSQQYNAALTNYYARNPNIPFEDRRPFLDFAGDRAFNWGILVIDENLPDAFYTNGQPIPKVRHMTREERVFYPVENFLRRNRGFLPTNALTEREYLKQQDLELISGRINDYNAILLNIVNQSNGRLALVDTYEFYERLYEGLNLLLNRQPNGIDVDGMNFFPGISKFGIFSADGMNLNPRGNALLSRELERAIENSFGGRLKDIDPNSFKGTPIKSIQDEN